MLVFLAFLTGRYPIGAGDLVSELWSALTGQRSPGDPAIATVLLELRAPRIVSALLIGAALAAAGAAYQSLFRNPLVSPDILGVSAGAAVGAVLGIFFSLSILAVQSVAFVFGLAAVAL